MTNTSNYTGQVHSENNRRKEEIEIEIGYKKQYTKAIRHCTNRTGNIVSAAHTSLRRSQPRPDR